MLHSSGAASCASKAGGRHDVLSELSKLQRQCAPLVTIAVCFCRTKAGQYKMKVVVQTWLVGTIVGRDGHKIR